LLHHSTQSGAHSLADFDPSGLFMSEADLAARFVKYDGDHVKLKRIALTRAQTRGPPSFPASDKRKDLRYKWFVARCEDQRSSVLNALDCQPAADAHNGALRHFPRCQTEFVHVAGDKVRP
jgi:hypothetical protein